MSQFPTRKAKDEVIDSKILDIEYRDIENRLRSYILTIPHISPFIHQTSLLLFNGYYTGKGLFRKLNILLNRQSNPCNSMEKVLFALKMNTQAYTDALSSKAPQDVFDEIDNEFLCLVILRDFFSKHNS